jgi:Domain of unknown function (DUF5753)
MDVSLERSEVTMMPLEQESLYLLDIEIHSLPSLVQTGDYARAVAKSVDMPPEHIEPWVEARLTRQFVLTKDKPPTFDMIVDEALLRGVVGDHKVMARQLRAILEATDRPNVELRVVPDTPVWLDSGYYMLSADFTQYVAYLEGTTSLVILDDHWEIEPYRQYTTRLVRRSLEPDESVDLVAAYAREHERS